jgi:hypothetical protein
VELEERSVETLPERCQNCGTALTEREKEVALERGSGVVLCTACAAEQVSLGDEEPDEETP